MPGNAQSRTRHGAYGVGGAEIFRLSAYWVGIALGAYDNREALGAMSPNPQMVSRNYHMALSDIQNHLGGGSVIDTAKGMCILITEGGSLRDHEGMQLLTRPQCPHIVIPTTAGTGSEVSAGAVVLDKEQGQKILIFEYHNIPRVAILDPKLTEKLPPALTASTGMDAMTHAVESYVSSQRNPIADAVALHAVKLVKRYLPIAVENG